MKQKNKPEDREFQNSEQNTSLMSREASFAVRQEGDDQQVELTASTETPVLEVVEYNDQIMLAYRILDHSGGGVDLSRATDGLVVTDEHWGDTIGLIEPARVEDKKLQGPVRWSSTERAQNIKQDAINGIRRNVSIDGAVDESSYKLEGERDGYPVLRAMKWQPHRLAFVSLGADPKSGVGREHNTNVTEKRTMDNDMQKQLEEKDRKLEELNREIETARKEAESAKDDAVKNAKLDRSEEIRNMLTLARYHNVKRDVVDEGIGAGDDMQAFRGRVKEAVEGGQTEENPVARGASEVQLSEKEQKRYSLMRAIRSLDPQDKVDAGFEREVSQEIERVTGKASQGIYMPNQVLARSSLTAAGDGANVIATDLMSGNLIELLRNRMALPALGANVLSGLDSDISIPRHDSGGTSYWVAEGNDPTGSSQTLGQVGGTPHTCGAYTDITRKLLRQSSIDVESFVTNDLIRSVALAIDKAGIRGTGSSGQPLGLVNRMQAESISAISVSGDNTPTYAEYAAFEKQIEADNADIGSMKWLLSAGAKAHARVTSVDSGSGVFILGPDGNILGYPTVMSNQLDADSAVFGVWSELAIGMWGAMDITVDPYALSKSGGLRVIVLQDVDVMVQQIKSFAFNIGHMGQE